MNKRCYLCKQTLAAAQFYADPRRPDGLTSRCKTCNRVYIYGISRNEYDDMFALQNGRCAICETDKPRAANKQNFYVDHDHETGKVRGLLCFECNIGLGKFKEDTSVMTRAIEYLRNA